tara:strand:- start:11055 stop:11420 length:366 start_codon:yes stop_codon:yes gene_type:complete
MSKRALSVNKNVKNIILTIFISISLTKPNIIQATSSVNMKQLSPPKAGNHGSIFYSNTHYQTISKQMQSSSQAQKQIANADWESVTYSPEETYIKLEKKMYQGKKPRTEKKLSFADIANQY